MNSQQINMKQAIFLVLATLTLLFAAPANAADAVEITPMVKVFSSVQNLKKILGCRILGVEIYSLLAFPEIAEDEKRELVTAKLEKAGFRLVEKYGVASVKDALERSTGKSPYPFGQKFAVKAGKYKPFDFADLIKKETGFWVGPLLVAKGFYPVTEFTNDEELTIRDALNRMAAKARGTWIALRSTFTMNGYMEAGRWVESKVPRINEWDGFDIHF